jgi:lysine biosynthesis protein LysW
MSDDIFDRSGGARSPKNKVRARCPACGAWVNLRDTAEIWDLVNCPECNTLLEIVDLRPPTLDYASNEVEDEEWDDEDWDDYDKP